MIARNQIGRIGNTFKAIYSWHLALASWLFALGSRISELDSWHRPSEAPRVSASCIQLHSDAFKLKPTRKQRLGRSNLRQIALHDSFDVCTQKRDMKQICELNPFNKQRVKLRHKQGIVRKRRTNLKDVICEISVFNWIELCVCELNVLKCILRFT